MQEHFEKVIGRLRTLEGLIERLQTVEGGGPATQIDETAGPTTLDIGAIADGEHLRRSGTNIVGHNVLTSGGWLEIPDGSWSYASATTIMVPSGAASIYAAGDQVRLKQGGAYKYFYVIAIADTTLTVTGGSDYSVANAAITDAAFSKGGGVGHPGWFNYTPTVTYAGGTKNPTTLTVSFEFVINGKQLHVMGDGKLTRVSGDRTFTTFTTPFAVTKITSGIFSCTFTADSVSAKTVYSGGTTWIVNHGTMNSDGFYWCNFFAKI